MEQVNRTIIPLLTKMSGKLAKYTNTWTMFRDVECHTTLKHWNDVFQSIIRHSYKNKEECDHPRADW